MARRGTLFGDILQHPDDIENENCKLIRANFEDALKIIEPTLLRVSFPLNLTNSFQSQKSKEELEEDGEEIINLNTSSESTSQEKSFQTKAFSTFKVFRMPLETLSLRSERILALDHLSQIFVWRGELALQSNLVEEATHFLLSWIEKQNSGRFPPPQVLVFGEEDSEARWLLSRLVPSHKDFLADQTRSFPSLSSLSEEERNQIYVKYPKTDEDSFYQFFRKMIIKMNN